jgi:hypothetical protein
LLPAHVCPGKLKPLREKPLTTLAGLTDYLTSSVGFVRGKVRAKTMVSERHAVSCAFLLKHGSLLPLGQQKLVTTENTTLARLPFILQLQTIIENRLLELAQKPQRCTNV